jgi:hypothetical protein
MTVTGDGGAILVACYTHGVQRFDAEGRTEGTYHPGGSATIAVPDFAGRSIAVATMEGELSILSGNGNIRWQTKLKEGPIALEMDALGRYVIHGLPSGEVTKLDLYGGGAKAAGAASVVSGRSGSGTVRAPVWSAEVVKTEDEAEFTVLAVLDEPRRVGVIGPKNKLILFSDKGKRVGEAPEIVGVGRILRTCPGWIAAATDRMILACDCRKNTALRVDLSLAELTHLVIRPDDFGLAIVQERDRIGRSTLSGRWVWKRELRQPVEEIAVGPEGSMALTLEDGTLLVHDPAGNPYETISARGKEPMCLAAAPPGAPGGVAWITLARRAQILRGHNLQGRPIWESPVPFEAWQMHPVGGMVVVCAPDGRSIAYDAAGHARGQSRGEGAMDLYAAGPHGAPVRIAKQGVHLICSRMDGEVLWRAVGSVPFGAIAVGSTGVAVMTGKQVSYYAMATET